MLVEFCRNLAVALASTIPASSTATPYKFRAEFGLTIPSRTSRTTADGSRRSGSPHPPPPADRTTIFGFLKVRLPKMGGSLTRCPSLTVDNSAFAPPLPPLVLYAAAYVSPSPRNDWTTSPSISASYSIPAPPRRSPGPALSHRISCRLIRIG